MTAKQRREAKERRLFTDGWADGAEQGAAAARRRIRRAIASALRILTECRKQRLPPRKYDIDTIDAATRAPKRGSKVLASDLGLAWKAKVR